MFYVQQLFFPPENLAVYETMWRNTVPPDTPQMTIWPMRIACWIPKATNTPSQYVILTASPLQQRLHDRASMLRYSTLSVLCFWSRFAFCTSGHAFFIHPLLSI